MVTTYLQRLAGVLFFSLLVINACAQDQRVTDLPVATSPDQDDVLYFIQDNISTQISKAQLFKETSDSLAAVTSTASTNATNISSNSVSIGANISDIASLEDSIAKHTDTLQVHQTQISALYDTAAIHLDTLQDHNTRLLSLEAGGGSGTVTSVAAGNGMDFTTITGSGSVTMGTPSTLTTSTTNALTSTSHTHELDLTGLSSDSSWTSIRTDTIRPLGTDAFSKTYYYGSPGSYQMSERYFSSDTASFFNIKDTPQIDFGAYVNYGDTAAGILVDHTRIVIESEDPGGASTISVNADSITFTDPIAGTYTLAELAAGGGSSDSSWVSIEVDTIKGRTENANITFTEEVGDVYAQFNIDGSNSLSVFDDNVQIWGDLNLNAGQAVNDIETTLTNDDTHLPTSGAVYDAISGGSDSSWVSSAADTVYVGQIRDGTHLKRGDDEELLINIKDASSVSITNGSFSIGDDRYLVADRIMHVIEAQVLYTNTSQTTIVTLPADAVIWDIQVEVTTVFNGGGNNYLDIGTTATGDRYENNANLFVPAAFITLSLTNVPDRMSGSTNITFQYTDSDSDATTGAANIYIHYSTH